MMLGLLPLLLACSPDDYSLGTTLSKEDLKYSITQDPQDPNTIILESLTPNAIPSWITPVGRSTKVTDKVQIAFPGVYSFVYSVMVNGGYVQADTFKLNLTTTNLNYVNNEYYKMLTGGVGESKRWIVDNGSYGLATGAMAYGDPSTEKNSNMAFNNYDTNWAPGGNANGSTDADMHYGRVMEFSLKNGPYMKVYETDGSVLESGTYSLDINAVKLSTTDAYILRPDNYIANASNWNKDLQIVELTNDRLCLAVMRTNSEGSWWYFWNYVSEDYANNYVPADEPDPNFTFSIDQAQALCQGYSQKWVLSEQTPFNWANLDGSLMNVSWIDNTTYDDWTGFNASATANYSKASITFRANGAVSYVNNDGVESTGSYVLDAKKNLITFSGVKPNIYIAGGWINATTTDQNQWKILKIEMKFGKPYGIWMGNRDPSLKQYTCYHFVVAETGFDVMAVNELSSGSSQVWKLDTETPFDWGNLWKVRLNGFTSITDYPSWTGYTANAIENFDKCRISFSADGTSSFTNDNGETVNGTFVIDKSGDNITFAGMDVNFTIVDWITCSTSNKQWDIFSTEYISGKLSAIWFGALAYNEDGSKKEYMVYKFIKTKK